MTCSGGFCRAPYERTSGVRVYSEAEDRWAASRPIWNQYAYHVTHVEDDGTVPRTSNVERNWESAELNNFRQNVLRGLPADAMPDLTVRDANALDCSTAELIQPLEAWVCNRGSLPVASGVLVEFHVDSVDGPLACSETTEGVLEPGSCTRVQCSWMDVPHGEPHDVYVVVDPPPDDIGALTECNDDNNLTWVEAVQCPPSVE